MSLDCPSRPAYPSSRMNFDICPVWLIYLHVPSCHLLLQEVRLHSNDGSQKCALADESATALVPSNIHDRRRFQ